MQIWISSILTVYEPNIDFSHRILTRKICRKIMQILFLSILTVLEPNIDLFPLHFNEKNLPQNHANPFLVDFDCLAT